MSRHAPPSQATEAAALPSSAEGPPVAPDPAARHSRAVVLGSVIGLIVLGLAWELWLAPTGSGTLAVKVLPLLLPLAGLWRYRLYTYRWVSLLLWLYAGEGLLRATSERGPAVALALVELVLALAAFAGCVVHVRSRLRRGQAQAEAGQAP